MAKSEVDQWDKALERDGRVVLHTDLAQALRYLLLLACLTAACVLALVFNWSSPIAPGMIFVVCAWIGLVFFGVIGIPVLVWKAIIHGDVTKVDNSGVSVNDKHLGWDEIDRVDAFHAPGGQMVLIVPTREAQEARKPTQGSAFFNRATTKLLGHPALDVPMTQGVDADAFATWLAEVHARRTGGPAAT